MKNLLSFGLLAALASGAFAQPKPIKDAMHELYANLEKAYNKSDIAAISDDYAPDFQWHMLDGKILKKVDAVKNLKEELSNIQSGKWKITIVNVIGAGDLATTVAQYDFRGYMLDDSKKPYKAEFISTERQNWIYQSGGWKISSDTILNLSSKKNGWIESPNVSTDNTPVQNPPPDNGGG